MYPNLQEIETTYVHGVVHTKEQALQRAFELVRRNSNEKQKHRKAIFSKKFLGPTIKAGQKVLLYHSAITVGTTSNCASSRKGQYIVEKCLKDVTFRIKEEKSTKKQIVHYDPLKPFFEPPPTSNVSTRNITKKIHSTQDIADIHKHIDETPNDDDCLRFLQEPSGVFTPILAVG